MNRDRRLSGTRSPHSSGSAPAGCSQDAPQTESHDPTFSCNVLFTLLVGRDIHCWTFLVPSMVETREESGLSTLHPLSPPPHASQLNMDGEPDETKQQQQQPQINTNTAAAADKR
ncbi:uncharacterized protein LOC135104743 [Scylla paramamosain]|uniref:uncharacterized protein LOC135104743 n=1 Tax=Scylla paramamosain TaxID=85552 RepID=UPI003082D3A9